MATKLMFRKKSKLHHDWTAMICGLGDRNSAQLPMAKVLLPVVLP